MVQQTNAIEVLKEEAAALRRDLAFVGNQINVTVSPVNQYLEDLPPLPALSNPPTAPEQSTEPIPHMLGIGPTAEVVFVTSQLRPSLEKALCCKVVLVLFGKDLTLPQNLQKLGD